MGVPLRSIARWALAGTALVVLLVVLAVAVLTNTPWGREQVRSFALAQLEDVVDGRLEVGRVEGNLLAGGRLVDVSLVDAEGRAFVRAESLAWRHSLPGFLRQRVILTHLELVDAHVVLDQPPDEEWNFIRIFAPDPDPDPDPEPGWGDWVELRDVRIEGSRLTLRMPWEPDPELAPGSREEQVRDALAGETLERVEEVPGGFQQVMDFSALDAHAPTLLVAHPEEDVVVELARMSTLAEPFRSPSPGVVEDLSGVLRVGEERLVAENVALALPATRLDLQVELHTETGRARGLVLAHPLTVSDLRFLHPPLPSGVTGEARVTFAIDEALARVAADELDFQVGEGSLQGRVEVALGDRIVVDDTELRFDGIRTELLVEAFPGLELPRAGALSGRLLAHAGDRAPPRGADPDADALQQGAEPTGIRPVQVSGLLRFDDDLVGSSVAELEGGLVPDEELGLEGFTIRLAPLKAELLTAMVPDVTLHGEIEGFVTADGNVPGPLRVVSELDHRHPTAGTSRITARGGLDAREDLRFDRFRVGLEEVQLDLLRPEVEEVPERSALTGFVQVDGPATGRLQVLGDLALDDPATGRSRVAVEGAIRPTEGPGFDSFRVAVAPFRMDLLRVLDPDLPVGGTLEGFALIDGAPEPGLTFETDLTHLEGEERSRLEGRGQVATADDGTGWVELEIHELSLGTVGRFAPEAELRGSVEGRVRAAGTLRSFLAELELLLPEDGELELVGGLAVTNDEEPEYDLALRLTGIDLSALSGRIEGSTALAGTASVEGQGTDLASMTARLDASLADEGPDEQRTLEARLAVEDGFARAETLELRAPALEVDVEGGFGLTADRRGRLDYRISVDSLGMFRPLLPEDTGIVEPRPAVRAAALLEVTDELREERRRAQVEFLATGEVPDPPELDDRPAIDGIRRDFLAGAARASGTVAGNIEEIEVEGDLIVERLLVAGHRVEEGRAAYTLTGIGREDPEGSLVVEAEGLLLAGFAYESARAEAEYRSRDPVHSGRLALEMDQDDETSLRATLSLEGSEESGEAWLEELALRFADATYRLPEPAAVSWSRDAVEVEGLVLESELDALVRLDGTVPVRIPARVEDPGTGMDLLVEELQLRHIATLLQADVDVEGRAGLEAEIRGTLDAPLLDGAASLSLLSLDGRGLPAVRASFGYRDRILEMEASVHRADEEMLTGETRLPVDLALLDAEEPRLLDGPILVDVRLLDLELGALAAFTDEVEAVAGSVAGHLSVQGTFDEPEMDGALDLHAPTMFIVPAGIRLANTAGSLRLEDRVLTVDSLVTHSRGPLRVTGEVDLARFDAPAFDLSVEARNTQVSDTEDARIRLDADLAVAGPFESVEVTGEVRTRQVVVRIPSTTELAEPGPLDLEDPDVFRRVDDRLVAQRDLLVERLPLFENLLVDLEVFIERDTWIRSPDLNVELFTPPDVGPLSVRMLGLNPRGLDLEGTVTTDRGEYEFMGRRFDLDRGNVTFVGEPGELEPLIRLTAEHEVQLPARRAFDIRIVLDGTPTELETEMESTAEPPLSQTDLLSFVVFGRDAGSLLQQHGTSLTGQGTAGGPLVGAVASRAAQQFATVGFNAVLTELEAETARSLGLDVLHIRPADFPAELSTGEFVDVLRGTEVEAGRYVTPRLFLSAQARPTFVHPGARMDYQTEHGWVWRVSWRPRFLPAPPTLTLEEPDRASVFGSVLFREWRF